MAAYKLVPRAAGQMELHGRPARVHTSLYECCGPLQNCPAHRSWGQLLAAAALPAEAARCRLRAEPTREGELLEAMLDPRWEKRPTASWLAGEFADLVRRRCARSRL